MLYTESPGDDEAAVNITLTTASGEETTKIWGEAGTFGGVCGQGPIKKTTEVYFTNSNNVLSPFTPKFKKLHSPNLLKGIV